MGVLIVNGLLRVDRLYFLEHITTGSKYCEPGSTHVTLFRSKRHAGAYLRRKRLDTQKWDVVECALSTDFENVWSNG